MSSFPRRLSCSKRVEKLRNRNFGMRMANLGRKQVTLWLYTWDLVADYPKQGCYDEYMTGHAPTAPTRPPLLSGHCRARPTVLKASKPSTTIGTAPEPATYTRSDTTCFPGLPGLLALFRPFNAALPSPPSSLLSPPGPPAAADLCICFLD